MKYRYSSSYTATPMSQSTTRSNPPQPIDIQKKLAAVKTSGF